MGRLLTAPWGDGHPHARSSRQGPFRGLAAGELDSLSVAKYRWKIISGRYDEPALLDLLADRLADPSLPL